MSVHVKLTLNQTNTVDLFVYDSHCNQQHKLGINSLTVCEYLARLLASVRYCVYGVRNDLALNLTISKMLMFAVTLPFKGTLDVSRRRKQYVDIRHLVVLREYQVFFLRTYILSCDTFIESHSLFRSQFL